MIEFYEIIKQYGEWWSLNITWGVYAPFIISAVIIYGIVGGILLSKVSWWSNAIDNLRSFIAHHLGLYICLFIVASIGTIFWIIPWDLYMIFFYIPMGWMIWRGLNEKNPIKTHQQ